MRTKLTFWLSMLWFLAAAILLTIYLVWLFYPLEISWFQLENQVYLKSTTIQHNFNILMNYLTNPFQQRLAMPNFRSSAAGLHHFQTVKYLFHLTQAIFLVTAPAVYFLKKGIIKKGYLPVFSKAILSIIWLPIMIGGIAFGIGFDAFFTLFHQILFVGDNTWLFDPAKDPVIWILPEEFFLHAFLLFFALYEGFALLLYRWSKKSYLKKEGH
ncbi:Uncharacterised protein [Streptococcus constellatus]|uniref:TIGR01906 family membrane protein n=1 Tax=Streptococcus constellatus TaxID=76860 RepID=A0A564SDZ7_STRCV|nr:TIGR01906 family membrane protein [Streptococcus constellatus]VUW92988.1 Uncharacterised protein [Streptococcus constellatus]VUX11508.1 Uncharacterised protein [Streptococcus gordonii]